MHLLFLLLLKIWHYGIVCSMFTEKLRCHNANVVITVGTISCHINNLHCQLSRAHIQQLSKAEFSPFIITQYRIWYRWCYKKANNQLVTKQNETKHRNNNPRQHWRSAQTLAQRWPNVGTVVPTLAQRWPNHQRRLGYHWEQYFKRQLMN